MIFEFGNCCCCVGLRTGSLIIGYFHLVSKLSLPLFMILNFHAVCKALGVDFSSDDSSNDIKIFILYFILVILLVNVGFDIALLFGIHKEKRGFVRAYLLFSVFKIVANITYTAGIDREKAPEAAGQLMVTTLIQLYCLLVIRSYYLKMEKPADMTPIIISKA